MNLTFTPIVTSVFRLEQNLAPFVIESLGPEGLHERDILAITSKIVSLSEGRIVAKDSVTKIDLVRREADHFLGEIGYGCSLTIKEGLLIPSAGIDESNSENDHYILYPSDPYASAEKLRRELCDHYKLRELGVLLTDSHTMPLRQGVTGVGLAYAGFKAVRDMIGQPDIFGRELKMTKMDLLDGLAAAAVLMMGEANECHPLALIRGAPVEFCDRTTPTEIQIPWERDLYSPLYRHLLEGLL